MKFTRLGTSCLEISEVTFGTALTIGTEILDIHHTEQLIDCAWRLGIRAFDTSNNYGMGQAEILLGRALKKYSREEYVVCSKGSWPIGESCYHMGLSRKHILWAFEQSLERLNTEYIDIYYAHRYTPGTSMPEVVRTFNNLIAQNKIRYWATSEWPVSALEECFATCRELGLEGPIAEQFMYSYAVRKAETNGVSEFCVKNGLGRMAFGSLAQGLLTGKYKSGIPPDSRIAKSTLINYDKTINIYNQNKERIGFFIGICERYGITGGHAAIQWCLRRGILPILGASKTAQLEENISALDAEIPEEFWRELEESKL
ncbi:MAG: aldo/keto reductase [Desulfovibrionaceae bacterium]|nr:aldo/keto reductase [Desulfovibrionaceae bacterium]